MQALFKCTHFVGNVTDHRLILKGKLLYNILSLGNLTDSRLRFTEVKNIAEQITSNIDSK